MRRIVIVEKTVMSPEQYLETGQPSLSSTSSHAPETIFVPTETPLSSMTSETETTIAQELPFYKEQGDSSEKPLFC